MPNLIVLTAVGVGAYLAYRWVKKQVREAAVEAAREAAAKKPSTPSERAREAGDLVWDEEAGVYRRKD